MYGKKQAARKKNAGLSQSTNSINSSNLPSFILTVLLTKIYINNLAVRLSI